jgi:hypothetical protein
LSEDLENNFIRSRPHRENFEAEMYDAISKAAGIPNDQWESIAIEGMGPEVIEGTPLSKFLLMDVSGDDFVEGGSIAPNDFQMLTKQVPRPKELHEAMALSQRKGYVSLIQPEYMTRVTVDFDRDRERFVGTVWFEAPDLYAGKVDFTMYYQSVRSLVSQLRVDEFELPVMGIKLVRGSKLWEKKQQSGKVKVLSDLESGYSLEKVRTAIRKYYVKKYPLFAASVNQRSNRFSDP